MDRENNQNLSRFWLFMLSLIPGCGHMYQGLMKRGMQLLLAFAFAIGIVTTIYSLEFIFIPLIVVLYAYSFFDSYSCYRNIQAGKVVEDESVIDGLDSFKKIFFNAYWIGLALIVLAIIILIQNALYLPGLREFADQYIYPIGEFVPAGIMLVGGIFLMAKGSKQRKKAKEEERYQSR